MPKPDGGLSSDARGEPRSISTNELEAVLEQARVEGWRELALRGYRPHLYLLRYKLGPEPFYVAQRIGARHSRALAALTGLTSLDLRANEIGDEGARTLAALTGLTSLDLQDNQIGDEGARAVSALTGLTSLD